MPNFQPLAIIADDLTGSLDTGVQFARFGFPTRLSLRAAGEWPVAVVNTASREIPAAAAAEKVHAAAGQLAGRRLFKKVDSTLRGHTALEIEAVLAASAYTRALVCPAAPLQGRVVCDGHIFVHGVPLHETAFRNDPVFPRLSSALAELIGRPVTHLPLSLVRGGLPALAAAAAAAPTAFLTADAETPQDLEQLSRLFDLPGLLLCGAFGLAAALAGTLSGRAPESAAPAFLQAPGRVLVIAGSANAAAHAQVHRLADHAGVCLAPLDAALPEAQQAAWVEQALRDWQEQRVFVLCPSAGETIREPAWLNFSRLAGRLGGALLERVRPAYLVIVGGETASHLCDRLGVEAIDLLGEAAPGIPFGCLAGGAADGLPVISKAGGFGAPDCLEQIIYPPPDLRP